MLRKYTSRLFAILAFWAMLVVPLDNIAVAQTPSTKQSAAQPQRINNSTTGTSPAQYAEAQAALVTEFDVKGLKVLVKRRAGSQTVATGLFIKGGARNLTEKNAGIESLMLEVATEASMAFPRERLRSETSRLGTGIGAGANYDYSGLSMGSTLANFNRSWEMFTDVALNPSFTTEDFERVKSRMLVSLSGETDQPEGHLQTLLDRVVYAGHPYANSPRGTSASISKITVEDIRRYHAQVMQTSRLLLVIVGDLDPVTIRSRVESTLGKLPKGNYQSQNVAQLSFATPSVEIVKRSVPTNYIQGIFVAPALTSDDIHAMRIASNILGQLVYQEVREKRNLSYAPDAFLNTQGANVGGISVSAINSNQAVGLMLKQISLLQQNQLNPQVIQNVVAGYLTNYYMRLETNAAQASELAQYELIGGGWRNSINIIERLRGVTPLDVQTVAQKYMRNIRFVVLGDPTSVDKNVFLSQSGE